MTEKRWTHFWDMHSGGGQKEKWAHIFIEAPEQQAKVIFYNRFGHNPDRVTCTCCGNDYSISEEETLEQATAYERGCAYGYLDSEGNEVPKDVAQTSSGKLRKGFLSSYLERGDPECSYRHYVTLEQYLATGEALVIRAHEIKDEERVGDVPQEGYVWV